MQGCGHLLRAAKGKALAMIVVRCVFSILLAGALHVCHGMRQDRSESE